MTDPAEEVDELIRFLRRPDYDWVEDWEEARELAAKAKPALVALEQERDDLIQERNRLRDDLSAAHDALERDDR